MVRAKFVVTQVTYYAGCSQADVALEARYSKQIPEDQRFAQATPTGKLAMTVTVPGVIDFFSPGKVLYLDFSEAPEGTSPYHE